MKNLYNALIDEITSKISLKAKQEKSCLGL